MWFDGELVARQGMTDQNCVRFVGIELAIGLIGDGERAEFDAGIKAQLLALAQDHAVSREGRGGAARYLLHRHLVSLGIPFRLRGSGRGNKGSSRAPVKVFFDLS